MYMYVYVYVYSFNVLYEMKTCFVFQNINKDHKQEGYMNEMMSDQQCLFK